MSDELTTAQWKVADEIAQALVRDRVKVNELQKAIAYLRTYGVGEGTKFFTYLQVLAKEGRRVGHSQQTQAYYESLNRACRQHLQGLSGDVPRMLLVLGWAARLLRYYSEGVLAGEQVEPAIGVEQAAIAVEQFSIGQILEATIERKNGVKVTYRLSNGQKLSNSEHKRHQDLQVGLSVKVEVIDLKENGMVNKIKLLSG